MAEQPNILIIWGDDIGQSNLSCYSDGLMGYQTPNIDRIAEEGARFTDYYGEQCCTAGRAAFITGQNPYRTGLTKVGGHSIFLLRDWRLLIGGYILGVAVNYLPLMVYPIVLYSHGR